MNWGCRPTTCSMKKDQTTPSALRCASNLVAIGSRHAGRPARSRQSKMLLEALHDLGLAYRGERDEVLIRLNPVE